MNIKSILAAIACVCLCQTCHASLGFDLGNPPITGNGALSSPYATLDIVGDTNAGTVTFTITPTQAGAKIGSFGFNSALAYTTDYTLMTLPSGWGISTGANQDGLGNYEVVVGSAAQADRVSVATIVVKLADASEATMSNFYELASGFDAYFAAHLYPANGAETGFIAVSGAIPEPASLLVWGGLAVAGVCVARRRMSK